MKKLISLIFLTLLSISIYAQQREAIASFENEIHNFGKIKEDGGLAVYKFEFQNMGAQPLIIKNVQASCGCTTPSYSKEPVNPGSNGYITVSFNPSGRVGIFEKSITVTTNGNPEIINLKIKGEVLAKVVSMTDKYKFDVQGLMFEDSHLAFTKIYIGQTSQKNMELFNSTDKPLKPVFKDVPKHITVKVNPEIIAPKGNATINITYNPSVKNDWGVVWDRISINVNGKEDEKLKLVISADISEDFSKLSDYERQNPPIIEFNDVNFNFDTIKTGTKISHDYKFINKGKRDLIIHKVNPSCGCTSTSLSKLTYKPGEEGVINVEFNSADKTGPQNKTITVLCNDPVNPKVILWVRGDVLNN